MKDSMKDEEKNTRRQEKKKNHRVSNLALVLILLTGAAIMAYPAFSEYWNGLHQSRAILGYAQRVAELTNEEYETIWSSALDYNERLLKLPNRWMTDHDEELKADYETQLNADGTGNMGFITIPKIKVNLPLYHGTTDSVLQTSIGHIAGTSLPAGSSHSNEEDFLTPDFASHCVLSGHRGLPSARLFSDLDAMEIGDIFYMTILDQTLTYEVDRITVIVPEDMSELEIVPGKDLCTLMTCTPYGVNTHRLLVRGSRIENEKKKLNVRITADGLRIDPLYVAPFIALPVLILMVLWVLVMTSGRRRNRR
jgi:sortase A